MEHQGCLAAAALVDIPTTRDGLHATWMKVALSQGLAVVTRLRSVWYNPKVWEKTKA